MLPEVLSRTPCPCGCGALLDRPRLEAAKGKVLIFQLCLLFAAADSLTVGQPANAEVLAGDELTFGQLHETCAVWWSDGLRVAEDLESAAHSQSSLDETLGVLEQSAQWASDAEVIAEALWSVRPALLVAWWMGLPAELQAGLRGRMPGGTEWPLDVSVVA